MQRGISVSIKKIMEALQPHIDAALEQNPEFEGYVLRFDYPKGSHTRVKVKLEEYKRLHRILTGVSTKTVWEYLKDDRDLRELMDKVPDEFYQWLKDTVYELHQDFEKIEKVAVSDFNRISADLGDTLPYKEHRKTFAEEAFKTEFPNLLFMMLDDKDYSESIWKMIRPEYAKPFTKDIDNS
jgi:RNA ligase